MSASRPNSQFNPDSITELNPALVYAFDPEAELKSSNFYGQLVHSSMQFMDMQNAYQYAQEVVLPAIRKKGFQAISYEEFEEILHQLHGRVAAAIAKDHHEVAGQFSVNEQLRCHLGRDFSSTLQSYLIGELSKEEFFNFCHERGLEEKDLNDFLKLSAKFFKNNLIEDLKNALDKNKLSKKELETFGKIYKFATPVSQIPQKMKKFYEDLLKLAHATKPKDIDSVTSLAFFVFYGIVQIHPYFNGNGRLATLMMNVVLRSLNWPSILMRYPQERLDPNSSYAVAVREIDEHPEKLKSHIKNRLRNPSFEDSILKRAVTAQVQLAVVGQQLQQQNPQSNVGKLVETTFNKSRNNPMAMISTMMEMPEMSERGLEPDAIERACLFFAAKTARAELEKLLKPSAQLEKQIAASKEEKKMEAAPTHHQLLIQEMDKVISAQPSVDLRAIFKPFFTAINNKEYSKALRTACNTSSHESEALALIKILYSFKDLLPINKDEKPASSNLSAVDYARLKKNNKILAYLESAKLEKGASRLKAVFRGRGERSAFFKQVQEHGNRIIALQQEIQAANERKDFKSVVELGGKAAKEQAAFEVETRMIQRWKR